MTKCDHYVLYMCDRGCVAFSLYIAWILQAQVLCDLVMDCPKAV